MSQPNRGQKSREKQPNRPRGTENLPFYNESMKISPSLALLFVFAVPACAGSNVAGSHPKSFPTVNRALGYKIMTILRSPAASHSKMSAAVGALSQLDMNDRRDRKKLEPIAQLLVNRLDYQLDRSGLLTAGPTKSEDVDELLADASLLVERELITTQLSAPLNDRDGEQSKNGRNFKRIARDYSHYLSPWQIAEANKSARLAAWKSRSFHDDVYGFISKHSGSLLNQSIETPQAIEAAVLQGTVSSAGLKEWRLRESARHRRQSLRP